MNVGIVVPGFSADASDWCIPALRDFVRRMARDEDLRIYALRYPYRAARYGLFETQILALGGGTKRGAGSVVLCGRTLATLVSEHRHHPFDLLHAFWGGETGFITSLAGFLLKVPVILSLAGGELTALRDISYGGQLTGSEQLKTGIAMRLADRVTAGSRYLLSLAARHPAIPSSRLRRTPLGVDTDLFRPDPSAPDESPPRLVQVASLVPVKDQATLLTAAGLLRDRGYNFHLEIAGSGPLDADLRSLAARLNLGDRAIFRGEIPHDRLPGFYAGAVAYVQSSRHEAQGMALLEAAACGVPAVGTRVGILPELEPGAAVGCEVGRPEQLATAMATLLAGRSLASEMSVAARAAVESEYCLERCVERFRAIYAEVT